VDKNVFNNRLDEANKVLSGGHQKKLHVNTASEKWLWVGTGVLSIVFIVVISKIIVLWNYQPAKVKPVVNHQPVATSSQPIGDILPGSQNSETAIVNKADSNLQADKLVFSQNYQAPTSSYPLEILANQGQTPRLPANIKSEAVNYYEVKRHYNLEPIINKLNQQGSVIVDNPFGKPEQDFFSFYKTAKADKWPLILTDDFLFYYYQNNLKEAYKSLEGGFYDSLWQVCNSLFDLSNRRYQNLLSQGTKGNDPILEAYRLDTQYWAVALKLLAPKSNQIKQDNLSASTIVFRQGDDQVYKMPILSEDLSREVDQEIVLINEAKGQKASPLFGQTFDYGVFKPKADYQSGGRLANFYLTSQWLRRPWPINYRDKYCLNCTLDRDDWQVNFLAANILARDLSSDQEFKNYWAKIYKTMSFFVGLRSELSYAHYVDAQKVVIGNLSIEEAVRQKDDWPTSILDKIQAKINENNFPIDDGGMNRQDVKQQPNIGLRVLQEQYWPGQQIDWKKVYPELDKYISQQKPKDWLANQFWSSLSVLKNWLDKTLTNEKKWVKPTWWRQQQLASAKFYLINWLLPGDQIVNSLSNDNLTGKGSQADVLVSIDADILPALDNQIAIAKMLRLSLAKLQVSNPASEQKLNEIIDSLEMIHDLAIKQAKGQIFSQEDIVWLNTFLQRNVLQLGIKNFSGQKYDKDSSLQNLRARIEVRNNGGQPYLFVGPVIKP